MAGDFDYDVALSFAGEQGDYVEKVAAALRARGIRVFYDKYEKADLLGKDLYEHLDYIYRRAARYCVVFASAEYAEKMWTTNERRSAQARAIEENAEYVLPARFDSTEIPGIGSTVGHIDLNEHSPEELSELIVEKLGPQQRESSSLRFLTACSKRSMWHRMRSPTQTSWLASTTAPCHA